MLRLMCDADMLTSERAAQPKLLTHEQRRRIAAAVRGLAVTGALGDFSIENVLFGHSMTHIYDAVTHLYSHLKSTLGGRRKSCRVQPASPPRACSR